MITGIEVRLAALDVSQQQSILDNLNKDELCRLLYLRNRYISGEYRDDSTPTVWSVGTTISYYEGVI